MIVVAALTTDRVIGRANDLPWTIPEEYEHFLSLIEGQTVIIGRVSWEIFGPDLDCKRCFVVSRKYKRIHGARVFESLKEAVTEASRHVEKVFCAGGASVYKQVIGSAEELYLSIIRGRYQGDAFFPEHYKSGFEEVGRRRYTDFDFVMYRRRLMQI